MSEFKEGTFRFIGCKVIVSIDGGLWHLSISKEKTQPSYKLLKAARYKFLPGDITVAQLFPPEKEFVNIHEFCHHLWELAGHEDPTKTKEWKN